MANVGKDFLRIIFGALIEKSMAVMGKNAGIVRLWVIAAVIISLLSDCSPEEDVSGAANVKTTFRLKSPSAMEGKVSIREVYLKLDRIQITGNLNGETNTDFTHPVPAEEPPYQLSRADSSQVYFTLPAHAYDQLNFKLYLLQDNYELTFQNQPVEEIPDPVEENDDQNGVDQPADNGGDESQDGDGDPDNGSDGNSDNDDNDDSDDDDSGDNDNSDGDDNGDDDGDGDGDDDDDDEGSDNDEGKDEDKDDDKKDNDKKDDDKKDDDKKGDKGKDDDKNKGDDKGDKGDDDKDDDDDDDEEDDDDDDDEEDDDGRTAGKQDVNVVDLDHFFQNAKPGMVILATYENNGKFTNIIFVAAEIESFSIPAKQDDSFNIVLKERNTAEVTFDPQSWFEGLSTADIESADRQIHQEQEVIFIHPGFNTHLFEILIPRIVESADLNFASN